jgi:hypothetical protein
MTTNLSAVLELPPLSSIRCNHALEHATLHVLVERQHRRWLVGHSGIHGFWIVGEVATDELESAVHEALQRLRNGEASLAVHPNCGTNFATAGLLAGGFAALAMLARGAGCVADRAPAWPSPWGCGSGRRPTLGSLPGKGDHQWKSRHARNRLRAPEGVKQPARTPGVTRF